MTKAQAIQAMKEGEKVTHRYFDSGEYIFIDQNGSITSEDGCSISYEDFWALRSAIEWDSNWNIYTGKN